MNNRLHKDGFTLVEILVAMTIIVTIVSMVYGSYFATSKSTQTYKARIALFQQGRKVLEQMARQIRCSYGGYFNSNTDDPSGEILHLVTTSNFWAGQDSLDGRLEVTYKFNKSRGLLSLSQERFIGASENAIEKRNWQPIARNISCLKLAFFDGQQWLKNWNFKDNKKLPSAVKIEITFEDKNYRQYNYGTIAHIACQESQSEKTQTNRLVAVKKQ